MDEKSFTLNEMDVLNESSPTVTREAVTFDPSDRGFVYAVVRRILQTSDEADDVTQDALLLAFRYRASFRGDARYRTWLYRIATTTALGHLRRQSRSRSRLRFQADLEGLEEALEPAPPPDEILGEVRGRALVATALEQLQPHYREILLARTSASESDVAAQLGISVSNVKIRAHRARKQLREVVDRISAPAA